MNKRLLSALCLVMLAANAMGAFPGRSSSIPKRRDGSSTTATQTESESSIRFTWVVPVAPRTSSFAAPATLTAHAAVATKRRSSTRWVRPESMASTWRPSERTAGMPIPIPLTTRS